MGIFYTAIPHLKLFVCSDLAVCTTVEMVTAQNPLRALRDALGSSNCHAAPLTMSTNKRWMRRSPVTSG